MNQQPYPTLSVPTLDVAAATAADIRALFAWYDFRDPQGHSLTLCVPFIELIERATGERFPRHIPPPPPRCGTGRGDDGRYSDAFSQGKADPDIGGLPERRRDPWWKFWW